MDVLGTIHPEVQDQLEGISWIGLHPMALKSQRVLLLKMMLNMFHVPLLNSQLCHQCLRRSWMMRMI